MFKVHLSIVVIEITFKYFMLAFEKVEALAVGILMFLSYFSAV